MQKTPLDTIQTDFQKKTTKEKNYLIATLAALIGTILPWFAMSAKGYFSVSVSGWNSWGYLSVIGSIAILALYIVPFLGIKIPEIFKNKAQEEKVLSGILVAGPILWLIETSFSFSSLGIGFYVTAIASGYLLYLVYKK